MFFIFPHSEFQTTSKFCVWFAFINLPFSFISAISTVEGVLRRTISGLAQDQPVRRHLNPEDAEQIDEYIKKIETLIELSEPFHVVSLFRRDL